VVQKKFAPFGHDSIYLNGLPASTVSAQL